MIDKKYLLLGGLGLVVYGVVVYFVYRNYKKSTSKITLPIDQIPPSPMYPPLNPPVANQPAAILPVETPPTLPPGVTPAPTVPPVVSPPAPTVPPVASPTPAPTVPPAASPTPAPTVPPAPSPSPPSPSPPLPSPTPTTSGPPPAGTTAPSAPYSRLWSECGKGQTETSTAVLGFCDKNDFLSNFYPGKVTRNGKTFTCAESAYHAAKFEDQPDIVDKFTTMTGDEAYKFVSTLKYDTAAFSKKSVSVMIEIVKSKFSDPSLMSQLKATSPKDLVEFNWWGNKFWGQSPDGENWLGRILMYVRDGKWKVY